MSATEVPSPSNEFLFCNCEEIYTVTELDTRIAYSLSSIVSKVPGDEAGIGMLAANQFGWRRRIAVLVDDELGQVQAADIYLTGAEGDAKENVRQFLNFPNKYAKFQAYPKVEISYTDIVSKEQSEIVRTGNIAELWQAAVLVLDGCRDIEFVDRDFRTYRRKEVKVSPNSRCESCGRKVKRCICS